jgi:hypothetical protein
VSPFAPKDRQTLRSFQKHEGNDKLDVKDSLPIVLTLFSIDTMAERLDAWFDKIVDSKSDLLDYVSLMMKRHAENLSAKSLQAVVSWFLKAKSKVGSSFLTVMSSLHNFVMLEHCPRGY